MLSVFHQALYTVFNREIFAISSFNSGMEVTAKSEILMNSTLQIEPIGLIKHSRKLSNTPTSMSHAAGDKCATIS